MKKTICFLIASVLLAAPLQAAPFVFHDTGPKPAPMPAGPTPNGPKCIPIPNAPKPVPVQYPPVFCAAEETPTCNILPPFSLWVELDFLYWRVFEDGLSVGFSNTIDTPTPNGSTTLFTENDNDLRFNWDPGFRVGIGQGFGVCGGWRTAAYWTHIHSHARRSSGCDLDAHWKLNFDMFDLLAWRQMWLNCATAFNVGFGVRGAVITQHFNVFAQNTLVGPIATTITDVDQRSHSKFTGAGPRLVLEGEWNTICNLSLYGSVGVSVLFGHFDVKFNETSTSTDSVDSCEVKTNQSFAQAVTDLGLGVRWKYMTCSGFKTRLQIGFEHLQFFKQNKLCDCGDLSFDGLVASFTFGF